VAFGDSCELADTASVRFGFRFQETVLVMCFGLAVRLFPHQAGRGAFHAALSGGLVLMELALEKAAAFPSRLI